MVYLDFQVYNEPEFMNQWDTVLHHLNDSFLLFVAHLALGFAEEVPCDGDIGTSQTIYLLELLWKQCPGLDWVLMAEYLESAV